ncbi:hypothetical protein LTR10_016680 [Elasticomyces elasticus]|uniref:DUF7702 domain-containing protein n=1 Tax=Exophiala sideris TaxID=1016849 RepID=A0ABR0JQS6_9EURO|nr:hypothetical protein LTR10_016680 [Elasticomyces elasticus]KAK5039879.1 hypothetical protein LTS07_000374 [Exophiala sideris]KAK5041431.1 hypothetical protein LTR13_002906 [Exophiala sideris]KAK5068258.1 hypothetical protein LTR69_000376 [Exophiala sideris]KAK5187559.1 hypothetical protein LTR44_000375 [Eurotiomycetes sp. CCFEE 6388]
MLAIEILSIIELVFFFPALLAAILVVYKHGTGKRLGWRFLVMICLFRVIGGICAIVWAHTSSNGALIAYEVMNSFGLSAIIYTALGLLHRVEDGMGGRGVSFKVFRVLALPGLAGLILSIVGATNVLGNSSNSSSFSSGMAELKAAVILFLTVYVADVVITAHAFFNITYVQDGEHRLLYAVTVTLPFMAVRIAYSLLCVFLNKHNIFSTWNTSALPILVHGLMGVTMEAIVVVIFLFVGFMTASISRVPGLAPPTTDGKLHGKAERKVRPPLYDLGARSV